VQKAETNINPECPLLKELIDGLESGTKFDHLRIILTKNDNRSFGQKYLMVTTSAFGVVKLLDLSVDDDQVFLSLQDDYSGITKKVYIDVDDDSFKFILISCDDIIAMTRQTKENLGRDNTILEFDY
jgi:hypothetical protein